jgi:hypothetical protein
MKFLFQNIKVRFLIGRITVVFMIFLNHFICDVSFTSDPITDFKKKFAPIAFPKIRKFFLKESGRPSFQSFYKIAFGLRWTILLMDMHMVFSNNHFRYSHIPRIKYLRDQILTSYLDVAFKNMLSIFCNPNYMYCMDRNGSPIRLCFFMNQRIQNWVATESLILKVHSFK